MTSRQGSTFLIRSCKQLPCLRLRPLLKRLFELTLHPSRALHSPGSLLLKPQRNKDTNRCATLGVEVYLLSTLIMCQHRTSFCCSENWKGPPPLTAPFKFHTRIICSITVPTGPDIVRTEVPLVDQQQPPETVDVGLRNMASTARRNLKRRKLEELMALAFTGT